MSLFDIEYEEQEPLHVSSISAGSDLKVVLFMNEEGETPRIFNVEDGTPEEVVPALKYGHEHGILGDVAKLLKERGVTVPGVSDLNDLSQLEQLDLFGKEP